MDKITTINGILMATQNDFNEHVEDATVHVTEEERTAWNAKADASALASHEENAAIHVSREENDTRYGQLTRKIHGRSPRLAMQWLMQREAYVFRCLPALKRL